MLGSGLSELGVNNMRYEEALEVVRRLAASGINPGLERVRCLLAGLGDPQDGLCVVHIGGTNGKGSVAAMLTAIICAAGLRVGTFTSPHLCSYTERFLINGRPVTRERLTRLVSDHRDRLEAAVRHSRLTEFELYTALALKLFREEQIELVVLEVGLGGRLDATNVVRPEVAVITNVSLDHQDYLGETVTEIAREKAGIVKTGVPLVTAAAGEALAVITAACRDRGASLLRVGTDVRWEPITDDRPPSSGQILNIHGRKDRYSGIRLPLSGKHQQVNVACAVAAAELLGERFPVVDSEAIRNGLAAVAWPGRFEVLPGRPAVVLDAAHNPAAAAALRDTLTAYFPDRTVVLVLGILEDKDRAGMTAALVPSAQAVVVTRPPSARAGAWEMVGVEASRYCNQVYTIADLQAAVDCARKLAGPEGIVVVTGSIYLIGAVRSFLSSEF